MKRTKIVATIGPSSSSKEVLENLIEAGTNVCRINFSHGTYEDHKKVIELIRKINQEKKKYTAILADLQGPKIRIREVTDNGVKLIKGKEVVITTKKMKGTAEKISINYEKFPSDVSKKDKILLDDGKLLLEVKESNGVDEVITKVVHGGILSSNKGVNLPNTKVSLPSLTEKDRKDLDFALQQNVEWIGLSFVRSARDIIELKHIISNKQKNTKVIAKIEKPEAIDEIDDILKETDGLMVARGDLGVEIPMENVPMIQKMLVKKSLHAAKPVIIATQMMESMIDNISPTRAEVNDVANAVMDGADAVMLSGETSIGQFPVKVVENMTKIIMEVEKNDDIYHKEFPPFQEEERFISDSVCYDSSRLAQRVGAVAIITMTHSGYTAFKISSFRPRAGVFIFTGNHAILNTLSLLWGVQGFFYDKFVSTDHTIADIKYILKKEGWVKPKELVINIASMPISEKGQSNMLKLSAVD